MSDGAHNRLKMIEVGRLIPHPDNPRKDLGDITELTESIKTVGILQNLTVTPAELVEGVEIPDRQQYYVVVIGHRRLAAAKAAGLEAVPCADVLMDRKEQLSTMLLENMQRSDLTPYEQAWGFQQMSLLGCSVEEISEKSGFSPATVRRRLKMAELDAEQLKQVTAERQMSLGDFDRLAEIEDIDLRNEALEAIGTNNFNWRVQEAKRECLARKHYPAALEWLKAHGAQEILQCEANGRKYEILRLNGGRYCSYLRLDVDDGPRFPEDKAVKGIDIFFVHGRTSISLYMHAENIDAGTGKKSRTVLDREKLARNTKKEIKELAAQHYELRKAFIEGLHVTRENRERVLLGAAYLALYKSAVGAQGSLKGVCEALGVRQYEYKTAPSIQGIGKITLPTESKKLLGAIYAMYADGPEETFASNMAVAGQLPRFENGDNNTKLRLLYEWLISLGYACCDGENQMLDGTHELYHRGKNA